MSKFKPGDKVMFKNWGIIGGVFKVETVREGRLWFDCGGGGFSEHAFDLADKPFTQQDLEVGMLVELDNGTIYDVEAAFLDNSRKGEEVVAIYKPTETGFEKVWTKPEPKLYTLELPNNTKKQRYYGVHTVLDEHYRFGKMVTNGTFKNQFTQKEIDNLPNQDLIKVLIKKEVV